jgi:hypothetical protein
MGIRLSFELGWVVSKWEFLGCGLVKVRLHGVSEIVTFEEMSSLTITRILKALVITTAFYMSNPSLAFLVISPRVIFSHTC